MPDDDETVKVTAQAMAGWPGDEAGWKPHELAQLLAAGKRKEEGKGKRQTSQQQQQQ